MTPLTLTEERKFQLAETCHIYDEHLGKDRVRDHCHISFWILFNLQICR